MALYSYTLIEEPTHSTYFIVRTVVGCFKRISQKKNHHHRFHYLRRLIFFFFLLFIHHFIRLVWICHFVYDSPIFNSSLTCSRFVLFCFSFVHLIVLRSSSSFSSISLSFSSFFCQPIASVVVAFSLIP